MNIYKRLKTDHNEHRELLQQIAKTEGDSLDRRNLWKKFYYDVSAHAAAEEEAFYADLMEQTKGQPKARHSVAEHKELDDIMVELNEMDMSSPRWLKRFKTLKDRYEQNIKEEENEIFDAARKTIGNDSNSEIGREFDRRKNNERALVDKKAEEALVD